MDQPVIVCGLGRLGRRVQRGGAARRRCHTGAGAARGRCDAPGCSDQCVSSYAARAEVLARPPQSVRDVDDFLGRQLEAGLAGVMVIEDRQGIQLGQGSVESKDFAG